MTDTARPMVPDGGRRFFAAIATGEYDDSRFNPLKVADEVKVMREWLCAETLGPRRFENRYPQLAAGPDENAIRTELKRPRWADDDAVAVFVTCHGVVANHQHWLVMHDTLSTKIPATALRTVDLIAWLDAAEPDKVLLIIDTCQAGAAQSGILEMEPLPKPGMLILASTNRDERAAVGAVTTAIEGFLAELATPDGGRFSHGPYLRVRDFVDEVYARLPRGQRFHDLNQNSQYPGETHVCLPNPRYPDAVARPPVTLRVEIGLAQPDGSGVGIGSGADTRVGAVASSRASLQMTALGRDLLQWLEDEPSTVVVAGATGSGKSWTLAQLAADPRVGFAIQARQKYPVEVAAELCEAAGVDLPEGTSVEDILGSWRLWVWRQGRQVTVVVDGLDAAADPAGVLYAVLAPLRTGLFPFRKSGSVRLAVGLRTGASLWEDRVREALPALWLDAERESSGVSRLVVSLQDDLADCAPYDRERVVDLLRALAFSFGRGMPWNQVWPAAANAVSSRHREGEYRPQDIAWLLQTPFVEYLTTDVEDGVTVYRVAHDELAEVLRRHPDQFTETTDAELRFETVAQRRITTALAAMSVVRRVAGLVIPPEPYICHHLVEHASAGGVLNDAILTPEFEPYIDRVRLAGLLAIQERTTDRPRLLMAVLTESARRHVPVSWGRLVTALTVTGVPAGFLAAQEVSGVAAAGAGAAVGVAAAGLVASLKSRGSDK